MKENSKETILILHNIRSTHNVGSIFRTADAAGVSRVYLSGYTPTPLDRFNRVQKDIAKTALGAEMTIPWESTKELTKLLTRLKQERVPLIAIEQGVRAVDYKKVKAPARSAFIVGNEVRGLSRNILSRCDIIAEIPMKGKKESLNVAVATGIGLFRMRNI
ncbi:MAG: TrmH family RNA methyltransferase [Patescibacteria group bacterium]